MINVLQELRAHLSTETLVMIDDKCIVRTEISSFCRPAQYDWVKKSDT